MNYDHQALCWMTVPKNKGYVLYQEKIYSLFMHLLVWISQVVLLLLLSNHH
jgi:hypothetical protein